MDMLSDMRSRAHVATSLAERISLTRDIALCALAFFSMDTRYYVLYTLGSRILSLPESWRLMSNFQIGTTFRASSEAVVVLADGVCPETSVSGAVTAYISAPQRIGWNLTVGHIFHVATTGGGRDSRPLFAVRMTALLQAQLRDAGLPDHFTMGPFHDALLSSGWVPHPTPGRKGRWTRSYHENQWLENGGNRKKTTSALFLVAGSRVARENVASATRMLAGFLGHPSSRNISQHVRDRVEASVKTFV